MTIHATAEKRPMTPADDQRAYWDSAASVKAFTHPLPRDWLHEMIRPDARILDHGCGYGRTLDELARLGYVNAVGVDFAPAMIARGQQQFPSLDLRAIDRLPLPDPDGAFDAVFLMAVLTCIPADTDQDALLAELRRVLRPGGVLTISDMPLQTDARNLRRYASAASTFGTHGVFQTEDGAIVRHHAPARIAAWLDGFDRVAERHIPLSTMNANPAIGLQILARRRD
jgi:SAM-dependent methyltransferase